MKLPPFRYDWTWVQDTGHPVVTITCRWGGKKWGFLVEGDTLKSSRLNDFSRYVRRAARAAAKTIFMMELSGTKTGNEAMRIIQRRPTLALKLAEEMRLWEASQPPVPA